MPNLKSYLKLVFVSCTFLLVSCTQNKNSFQYVEYPESLKTLHNNIVNYHLNLKVSSFQIKKILENLKENGSFLNIDYTNKERGNWPVKNHLKYIQNLAIDYHTKTSEFYGDKNLSIKIHSALNYWLDNDFLSTNWWDQQIGVPELLLPVLFLMENELNENQLQKAYIILDRAKIKMSGQNKVWLSTNVMLTSLLKRNEKTVAIASKAIQGELKVSKKVGIKSDWSYHEHGAQLQFGNYGLSFLEDMIKCYQYVHNTPYQFKDEKITILRNYVLKGQQWIIWNKTYDISAAGRQLFPKELDKKFSVLKASIDKMQELDKDFYDDYQTAKNSKLLEGNQHFYRSDFEVHRKKDFYFSVKMSSKRVIGTESVNKENVQGYYLGDGVSLLYTDKNQYNEIFPFWDWKKLPGSTIIQDDKPLPIIKFKEFKTNSNFVGGVSNGKNGIAVLNYNRDGLLAKKSWFMFDDKIVCLGTDINSKTNFPVTTTLNQVFLKGDVIASQNQKINTKFRGNKPVQLDWILHDDIGYLLNNNNKINVQSRFLEGSWNNVAKRFRPVILTETILKIWLDHGKNPKKQSYEYTLVPNATSQKMTELHQQKPFEIINTNTQQSVVSSDKKIGGIVFYKAGKSKLLGGISVDKPCVLMYQKRKENIEISLSDPTQKLGEINLSFQKYRIDDENTSKNTITIQLQQGEKSGKTETFYIKE